MHTKTEASKEGF